jgi:hypothetical protein
MNSATTGSTVNIMAGTYQERLTMDVSGTSGNYITFQPYNFSVPSGGCGGYTGVACGGDQVILDYASLGTVSDGIPVLELNGKSYVRIQGLTFQNFSTLEVNFLLNWGVRVEGASSFISFQYNHFLNFVEKGPDPYNYFQHNFWIASPANNITLYGNEFGNIQNHGEALVIDGSSQTNATFQNNWFHDVDQIGIDLHGGSNNYHVIDNKLEYISIKRDGTAYFNNPSSAIYNDGGNTGVIERNFVNHAGVGIQALSEPGQPATHDIIIRNNVVENCMQSGIVIGTWYSNTDGSSVSNINVLNNTFYQNNPNVAIRPMVSSTVAWENNIFYGSNNYANPLNWNPGTVGYNLYFGGGTGPGSNNLTSDPLFVSASTGNFSLQSTSASINAGDPNSSTTLVGTVDLAGSPRIQGGRIDIGAFEIQ